MKFSSINCFGCMFYIVFDLLHRSYWLKTRSTLQLVVPSSTESFNPSRFPNPIPKPFTPSLTSSSNSCLHSSTRQLGLVYRQMIWRIIEQLLFIKNMRCDRVNTLPQTHHTIDDENIAWAIYDKHLYCVHTNLLTLNVRQNIE